MSDSNGSATEKPGLDEEFARELPQAPLEARLHFEHAEKWVAWAPDDQSVIAFGDDPLEVRQAARQAGYSGAVMEWIGPPYRECPSSARI